MTGLTTRTLRNYLKMNVLKGEKLDGAWKFTEEEFAEFIQNPYVKPSLQAKNKAIVFDFLAQNEKRINEICTVIDVCVDSHEAEEISSFFCEEINKRNEGNINNLNIVNRTISYFELLVDVEVKDLKHLMDIIAALKASKVVSYVSRSMQ